MRRLNWLLGTVVLAQVACGSPESSGSGDACDGGGARKTFYRDADTDGFGDPAGTLEKCAAPAGYVDNDLDCDDTDERVSPDTPWHPDLDGDGFGDAASAVTQCVSPKDHVLDGSDCDDTDPDLGPTTPWYADEDGDGFGDPTAKVTQCEKPSGHVSNAEDCDDGDAKVSPDSQWFEDADGDGFGATPFGMAQCEQPPGHVLTAGDCDDQDPTRSPETRWYKDADKDGWGDSAASVMACLQPMGYVAAEGDCDDGAAAVYPGLGSCPFDVGGKSCKEVLDAGDSRGDGAYLIDMDGAAGDPPVVAWCDMTTDGGGWTALLNPSNQAMPTPTLPNMTFAGAVLSGTDSCQNNAVLNVAYDWNGVSLFRCGDTTIRTTLSWPNGIGATDLMYTAVLSGQSIATVTADGIDLPEDAVTFDAGGGRCEFHNGPGASTVAPIGECHNAALDAAPAVHLDAFTGSLSLELTSGPGCQPTCQYGVGQQIHRLFVR